MWTLKIKIFDRIRSEEKVLHFDSALSIRRFLIGKYDISDEKIKHLFMAKKLDVVINNVRNVFELENFSD